MVTIIFGTVFFFNAVASGADTAEEAKNTQQPIFFQVIQSQMKLDSTTVESATLVESTLNGYGLDVKLKAIASSKLEKLTEENIGKKVNIIINRKIISSPVIGSRLGGKFLLTGLTKEQAEQFVKSLTLKK